MSWNGNPSRTSQSHDNVVVWLQVPTRRIHVPSVEFFLGLEEAGVVAVRRDTQVIRRFNVVVTDVVSQEQKKGHTTVSFGSVGLHW
jgi:hypothetical protein